MLRISKLTDYATIILSYLASHPLQIASATRIAKESHLSVPTVSKILKKLCETQLVNSFRGAGGGYQLGRPARQISLEEIILALEGKGALTECCSAKSHCALDTLCAVKENWQVINKVIFSALAGITLHDMIRPLSVQTLRGIPIKVEI